MLTALQSPHLSEETPRDLSARLLPEFAKGNCAGRHLADWPSAKARALHRAFCRDEAFTTGWYAPVDRRCFARITRVANRVVVETRENTTHGAAETDLSQANDATILALVEKAIWRAQIAATDRATAA